MHSSSKTEAELTGAARVPCLPFSLNPALLEIALFHGDYSRGEDGWEVGKQNRSHLILVRIFGEREMLLGYRSNCHRY